MVKARIRPHCFGGAIRVPASKSHCIRRLLIAALAEGVSEIDYPLDSLDARSCLAVCRGLGAEIEERRAADPRSPNPADEGGERLVQWRVRGTGGRPGRRAAGGPEAAGPPRLDVGNSGTTLYLALAAAALGETPVEFTGDAQIQRRSAAPLLAALSGLGIRAESLNHSGCAPILIQGPWRGGRVVLPCPTSQYLSALLLAAPLAPQGVITEIDVPLLNERPYIEMTLSYLRAQHIPHEAAADFSRFVIPGGAIWRPLSGPAPGDFSSAAFPACAAVVSGGAVRLPGLDPGDTQGDKFFFEMLARMGCEVRREQQAPADPGAGAALAGPAGGPPEWALSVSLKGPLRGGEFDLNAAPDLLPAAAVLGAYATGDTALVNVAHARIKETDRIAVMAAELAKLGVRCTERPDGLVIHGGAGLAGGRVDGHGDHRIVMALAAGACGASGPVEITGAEHAAVTYPGFLELLDAERD
ncbi:MAG: 3-phosphoshikimate 1-carboxyvinyltransferase [Treponema sp.]|jgi:3-phosphoshikimate 1-carboxyvinyltransferase|nr:3-phosphoshikimate 1-carboxyvinyltransferase [Treponema sp.]